MYTLLQTSFDFWSKDIIDKENAQNSSNAWSDYPNVLFN